MNKLRAAFTNQRYTAKTRGIPFRLTYRAWAAIWKKSGHLHERGKLNAVDAGWEILDILKPGAIPDDVRCMLAGMIAGRLMKEREGKQGVS